MVIEFPYSPTEQPLGEEPSMPVSLGIRQILIETEGTYVGDLHRRLKELIPRRHRSYITTSYYLKELLNMGLVEKGGQLPSGHRFPRQYYYIPLGMEEDKRWKKNPHHVAYPQSTVTTPQGKTYKEEWKARPGRW